jgi:AAHS family 4-hydroxybenzoate transporter-like MFS transporter
MAILVAVLCGAVLLLEGYDLASIGYAIPSLVDVWHLPPAAFTTVLTSANVGLMAGSLAAGLPGDRVGRKPVLMGAVLAFGVFSCLSALVHTPTQFAIVRFLTGLGLGAGLPITVALASDFASEKYRGRLVTLVLTGPPIGFVIGGLVASRLVVAFGWPAIFIAGGVLPLAMIPLLALWLPESVALHRVPREANPVGALFRDDLAPTTLLLWPISLLNYLGLYFILLWTPAILHSTGVTPPQAILATTVYALGLVASPLITASLISRFQIEPILVALLTFGALCALAIGFTDPRFALLVVLLGGVGIGAGCQSGINALSGAAYPPAIRSTGAGWAMGVGRIGTIAGPLLGGLLIQAGLSPRTIFSVASIPALGAASLLVALGQVFRSRRSTDRHETPSG